MRGLLEDSYNGLPLGPILLRRHDGQTKRQPRWVVVH